MTEQTQKPVSPFRSQISTLSFIAALNPNDGRMGKKKERADLPVTSASEGREKLRRNRKGHPNLATLSDANGA